jgi:uncharacterized protein YdeI (YjbR/CyaY-like superfamily)
LVHIACPEVTEVIKWGFPNFEYKGPMFSIAAFKAHCAITFWKGKLMKDAHLMEVAESEVAMGHFGKIKSLQDLPSDEKMIEYLQEAMDLNERGIKLEKSNSKPKKEYNMPALWEEKLNENPLAKDNFNSFSPSKQNEYKEWICEAKTEATLIKRITQALILIEEGKARHWKYGAK